MKVWREPSWKPALEVVLSRVFVSNLIGCDVKTVGWPSAGPKRLLILLVPSLFMWHFRTVPDQRAELGNCLTSTIHNVPTSQD